MLDLVQAQKDLTALGASSDQLISVGVVSYRQLRIDNETDTRKVLTSARNGRTGAGLIVCMPEASQKEKNITGPVLDWVFPLVCMEQPFINMDKVNGTLIPCEELAQRVMDIYHLFADELYGQFYIGEKAVQEEKNLTSVFPGCIGLRVNLYLKGRSQQILRLAPTIFSYDRLTGILTLSCATPGATIKYTLDGSFPAADIANNPSSFHYTGPFYVDPGITVRAAAW